MSILGAMYSAVSGLGAQSTKLGVISDNIANSSTTGYKRSEVQFSSLVTQQISNHAYSSGGVQSDVRRQVDKQGLLQSTSSNTDIASWSSEISDSSSSKRTSTPPSGTTWSRTTSASAVGTCSRRTPF